ncbi:hypothetical protein QC764_408715 [Podospora pseudoanserina]|uniref:Uncharacterized protein n=1 Tax=Podospora pseudoanserina TaxID=2609844 RepID=A0ABR0I9P0_9PEZI|nr:hypothetical protein QC764_408715 [Podospora pseudoanserina]
MLSRGELADEPVRLAVLKQLLEAVTKLDWYSKIRSMGNGAMFSPGNIFVNSKNGSMKLISFRDVELLGYFEGFEESDDDDDPGPYWIPKAWAEKPQSAARWLIDTGVADSEKDTTSKDKDTKTVSVKKRSIEEQEEDGSPSRKKQCVSSPKE